MVQYAICNIFLFCICIAMIQISILCTYDLWQLWPMAYQRRLALSFFENIVSIDTQDHHLVQLRKKKKEHHECEQNTTQQLQSPLVQTQVLDQIKTWTLTAPFVWTTLNHAHDLFFSLELCKRLDSLFCVWHLRICTRHSFWRIFPYTAENNQTWATRVHSLVHYKQGQDALLHL